MGISYYGRPTTEGKKIGWAGRSARALSDLEVADSSGAESRLRNNLLVLAGNGLIRMRDEGTGDGRLRFYRIEISSVGCCVKKGFAVVNLDRLTYAGRRESERTGRRTGYAFDLPDLCDAEALRILEVPARRVMPPRRRNACGPFDRTAPKPSSNPMMVAPSAARSMLGFYWRKLPDGNRFGTGRRAFRFGQVSDR